MFTSTKMVRRLFIIAGLSVVAASASAFGIDPQIVIDRALDSPTLTVRYNGVSAALIELKVNGESLGTRSVSANKNTGETNFTLNLSDLREGDNDVEVRLFDRTGRLVGHEHTNIQSEAAQHGPVTVSEPRMGATVLGPVTIKVELDSKLRNPYVSFFIDGNFKSMSNFPPYNYVWDSERETNGWHELEAWAIDDSNETHKTHKMRVFVNNPQGRTNRPGVGDEMVPAVSTRNFTPASTDRGLKHVSLLVPTTKSSADLAMRHTAPKVTVAHPGARNPIEPVLSSDAGTKPVSIGYAIPTGPHHLALTGKRLAKSVVPSAHAHQVVSVTDHARVAYKFSETQIGPTVTSVVSATNLMAITKGSRLPDLSFFAIALDSNFVDFHGVDPRVDDGVPMTPLRFLLEQAGGKVNWENQTKQVHAKTVGRKIDLRIGDSTAKVNQASIDLEKAPYLDRGRTIVPLSFIRSTLNVQVQYDKKTGHVLITSLKK